MNSKQLKQILESPITKGAKGRFISIEELEQIKTILEAWEVVKNKGVDMLIFMLYINDLQKYNDYISSLAGECNYEKLILTQQEANKIKKALEVKDE